MNSLSNIIIRKDRLIRNGFEKSIFNRSGNLQKKNITTKQGVKTVRWVNPLKGQAKPEKAKSYKQEDFKNFRFGKNGNGVTFKLNLQDSAIGNILKHKLMMHGHKVKLLNRYLSDVFGDKYDSNSKPYFHLLSDGKTAIIGFETNTQYKVNSLSKYLEKYVQGYQELSGVDKEGNYQSYNHNEDFRNIVGDLIDDSLNKDLLNNEDDLEDFDDKVDTLNNVFGKEVVKRVLQDKLILKFNSDKDIQENYDDVIDFINSLDDIFGRHFKNWNLKVPKELQKFRESGLSKNGIKKEEQQTNKEQQSQIEQSKESSLSNFNLPSVNKILPVSIKKQDFVSKTEVNDNTKKIQNELKLFGIKIKGVKAISGPTITTYEVTPDIDKGTKVRDIENLSNELSLSLKTDGVRIAPIPEHGVVGIEIPNKKQSIVKIGDIINSKEFKNSTAKVPLIIGVDAQGKNVIADLTKLPHLLIGGTTGSGKSVALNSMVTGLLSKFKPDELKLAFIDPKQVEFSLYNGLDKTYLLKNSNIKGDGVITNPEDAGKLLKNLVDEVDRRDELLKDAKVKSIDEYNAKGNKMPRIVLVIDELADLMATSKKSTQSYLAQLAAKARASGIHLLVATQRPSADVVTGVIKANFPARLAFEVNSRVNSQVILDEDGAENLVGKGDGLFLDGKSKNSVRIQSPFTSDEEQEAVVENAQKQKGYDNPYTIGNIKEDNEEEK